MSKIKKAFLNGKACIPFITCGDPDLDITKEAIVEMARAGADVLELGIPFSDPTVEGTVVQEANLRALKNNITTDHIMDMVEEVRKIVDIPLVFVTYANVVYSYGVEAFVKRCKEVQVQGLALPDIPYEEKEEFESVCEKYGVHFIVSIAPTSKARIAKIAKAATGFLRCESTVETPDEHIKQKVLEMVEKVKEQQDIPCVVHYEQLTAQQAAGISHKVQGVILGSSVVSLCAEYGKKAPQYIGNYVKEIKLAMSV